MPTDIDQTNFNQATTDLGLNQQEQDLYQMHLKNLWGNGGVNNADGSRSTLYQTIEQHDGSYYSVPTVWNGKKETEKWTRPSDGTVHDIPNQTALDNVAKIGWDKFPSGKDPDKLDSRYMKMHDYMEKDTSSWFEHQLFTPQ